MKKNTIIKALLITGVISVLIPALSYAENINIQADKQTFDGKNTTFEGKVNVDYGNINVKSPKVLVKSDPNGKPENAVFMNGAHAVKKSGYSQSEVKADIINLSLLKNRIKAEGNSESLVLDHQKPVVHIAADTQEFDIKKNIIIATNNVKIKYQDLDTISNKARISIDEKGDLKKVELLGAVTLNQGNSIVKAADVLYNPETNEMVAFGNAYSRSVMDNGTFVDVKSDYQQYDRATQTMIASGQVKIDYKNYVATGPKATFITEAKASKPNKIIFTGRSKIVDGERRVEADRIEITLNPKNFTAVGNVKTRFSQVKSFKEMKK